MRCRVPCRRAALLCTVHPAVQRLWRCRLALQGAMNASAQRMAQALVLARGRALCTSACTHIGYPPLPACSRLYPRFWFSAALSLTAFGCM